MWLIFVGDNQFHFGELSFITKRELSLDRLIVKKVTERFKYKCFQKRYILLPNKYS
jgi:hypothetical protein